MTRKIKNIGLILITIIFLGACSSSSPGIPQVNPDLDPDLLTIPIGPAQSNNSSYVIISLEIYGGTVESLNGASLDIYLNGALTLGDLDPIDYYNPVSGLITFNFSPTSAGSILGFGITTNEGAETYYEGVVDAVGEAQAIATIRDFSVSEEQGVTATFFDNLESATGTGSGGTFSGTYTIQFGTFEFTGACDAQFVKDMEFYVDSSLTVAEVTEVIKDGAAGFESTVILTQTDGVLVWDDINSTISDFVGIIDSDGTFSIFDGTYIDEANYSYMMYSGTIEAAVGLSGTFSAELKLDGDRTVNGLDGSCAVSSDFTGTINP